MLTVKASVKGDGRAAKSGVNSSSTMPRSKSAKRTGRMAVHTVAPAMRLPCSASAAAPEGLHCAMSASSRNGSKPVSNTPGSPGGKAKGKPRDWRSIRSRVGPGGHSRSSFRRAQYSARSSKRPERASATAACQSAAPGSAFRNTSS